MLDRRGRVVYLALLAQPVLPGRLELLVRPALRDQPAQLDQQVSLELQGLLAQLVLPDRKVQLESPALLVLLVLQARLVFAELAVRRDPRVRQVRLV